MFEKLMFVAYLMGLPTTGTPPTSPLTLSSPAFKNAAIIPPDYTCYGRNISIPLRWKGVPPKTKSLALIVIDQDVPRSAWYHWAVYNIPPNTTQFQNNYRPSNPVRIANNSRGNAKYQGPCPLKGEHHYIIQLYALDKKLSGVSEMTTLQLREKMRHHILASTEIMGRATSHPLLNRNNLYIKN